MILVYIVDEEPCSLFASNCFVAWNKVSHFGKMVNHHKD